MTLRMRLTVWYGSLFALVLLVVVLLSYAFHTSGHYNDLDRALVTSAGHAVAASSPEGEPHIAAGSGGLEVGLRLYNPAGALVEWTQGSENVPAFDPGAIMAAPSGPAFDPLLDLVPHTIVEGVAAVKGAHSTVASGGQRWRVYMLPIGQENDPRGYVAAFSALGRLDQSIARYRALLAGVAVVSLLVTLSGSWLIASAALHPVAALTDTARLISGSRDLSRRVDVQPRQDELGRLAATFNGMLDSVESAHRVQQRFIADASHELRAPLTVIQGNLELLRRQKGMDERDRGEMLADTEREAARLSRLVSEMLALARADAGVPLTRRPVELDALVLQTFQQARQLSTAHHFELSPFGPAQVEGDPDQITQLLLILLDNAVKYTPEGGRVTLSLSTVDGAARIEVRDTGVGIPEEALPHVFERFYRADPARTRDPGGTGLGLAIAQWLVRQHGGEIHIRSGAARGTAVTVTLPLSP